MHSDKFRKTIIDAIEKDMHGYVVELCCDHLMSNADNALIWTYFARALTLFSRYPEAENAFDQAHAQSGQFETELHSIIFSSRGELNQRRGTYAEAEKWYFKAIEAKPEAVGNHISLGVLLFRCGDLELAEERLRIAIEIGGEETDEAYLNLGGVLMAQERYEEARECYLSAIELCPDYKLAKLRLRDVSKILKMRPTVTDSSVAEALSE